METETKEQKKEVNQRELTKVEEWDQVAFTLIHQELAPKGYKEIKSGNYSGSVEANIPFLSKKSVQKCQKITAQMVRTFRDRIRKELLEKRARRVAVWSALPWWNVITKSVMRREIDTIESFIQSLDKISVK